MKAVHAFGIAALVLVLLLAACSPQAAAPSPTVAPVAPKPTTAAAAPAATAAAAPTAAAKPTTPPAPAKISYPEKPVTLLVGYPPGGPVDMTARAVAEAAKPFFPQPFTIVNRGGGGGSVATVELVQAKPDGYTLMVGYGGSLTVQNNITDLPYKGPDDYIPVLNMVQAPIVFPFAADAQWKTMKEVVDYAKANPGKIRVASSGIGTAGHLTLEVFMDKAGIKLTHVPMEGAAPSVTALLGGHVETTVVNPSAIMAQVQAGKAKVLMTASDKRVPVLPDTPTARELGWDVTALGSQYLIIAPKGTPDAVVQVIHDAFKKGIESDSFQKFAKDNGYTVDYRSQAELRKQLQADYDFFKDFVKKIGLKS